MQTRKIISFLVALICVTAMIWMEISITPLSGWKLAPVALLIAAIGIGRMYLFYEGTALREIGTKPARIAFRMSLTISAAFAIYVSVLAYFGKADWYELSLFQLGNIVLLCVEWIFSFRQGAEVNTLLNRLRNRGYAMLKQAENEQKRHSERADALSAENSALSNQLNALRNELSELKKTVEFRQIPLTEQPHSALNSADSASEKAESVQAESVKTPTDKAELRAELAEIIVALRAEFPHAEAEFRKVSALLEAGKAKNRRDYLRKKHKSGTLNGQATEYEILKRLTL